jgi:hypothetical protein
MMPAISPEESFRLAFAAEDLSSVEAAARQYLAWFQSQSRTLAEIAAARDLFQWGAQAAVKRKECLAEELARLTVVFATYRPPRISNTWHLDV